MYLYIGTAEAKKHPDLSPTHSAVLQLAKTLPYRAYEFTLFCDNLFGNHKLFSLLRQLGIGACGTARKNVTAPIFGSLDTWKVAWGTLHSKVVDVYPQNAENGKVLMSIWQDSNKVGFLSTVHDALEWTVQLRKLPRGSSTYFAITKQPFIMFDPPKGCKNPYEWTRLLPIPGMIDDYNHFMGGVDIADQLRAHFSTQLRGVKTWKPLFYWLLDTAIVNAYLLFEHQRKAKLVGKDKARSMHRAFREALVSALLLDLELSTKTSLVVTKTTELPHSRLTRPIEIHGQEPVSRTPCLFCRWQRHNEKGRTTRVITKTNQLTRTRISCSHCKVPLCGGCFTKFHYYVTK
jgi:Transposase IS4